MQIGLIHLALPNAKIIDARRHPLDCCFSNFRQHYAKGQSFSYGLADVGGYYRDYVRLMAHIDAVQPGRVHRVIHEALLDDPEGEVRAMLAYLNVPFEEACLRFHEAERSVRSTSSRISFCTGSSASMRCTTSMASSSGISARTLAA